MGYAAQVIGDHVRILILANAKVAVRCHRKVVPEVKSDASEDSTNT
jgi:hypothetical protein